MAVPCSRALIRSTRMDFAPHSQWKAVTRAQTRSPQIFCTNQTYPKAIGLSDCCFEASQFSYSIFHNSSVCCGLANPLAPLHLWQLCYCLYCCRKERCFTSFLGYYRRLVHAERCSCRLQPWWLATHPHSSRHQHGQCICSAEPHTQLGGLRLIWAQKA